MSGWDGYHECWRHQSAPTHSLTHHTVHRFQLYNSYDRNFKWLGVFESSCPLDKGTFATIHNAPSKTQCFTSACILGHKHYCHTTCFVLSDPWCPKLFELALGPNFVDYLHVVLAVIFYTQSQTPKIILHNVVQVAPVVRLLVYLDSFLLSRAVSRVPGNILVFYYILLLQSRNLILRSGGKGGCLVSMLVCWYPHSDYSTQIASSSNPSCTLSDSLVVSAMLTRFPATWVVFSSVSIVASSVF